MNQKVITGELEHTSMRCQLVCTLKDLSDRQYQKIEWCSNTAAHRFWDNLSMVIDFFDDIMLFNDADGEEGYRPIDQIGYSVRSEDELELLSPVIKLLDRVLKEIGQKKSDFAYLNSPIWEEVIQASSKAFQYIKDQGLDQKFVSWAENPKE
jgi:hypothetical protein